MVMPKVTDDAIATVLGGIVESSDRELPESTQEDLEKYWFFRWDDKKSPEWNTYKFHDMLKLYGSWCRRWEEMHHGSCCVVERVRDKYLLPKIREFVQSMRHHLA
jgi:hypothetical protein